MDKTKDGNGGAMSEYERNEHFKMSEMKFSPSYDMSKVITNSGQTFLKLKSLHHYYDFNSGLQRDNAPKLKNSKPFSVIVKHESKETETNDDTIPIIPQIIKLSRSDNVFVFIPFCELIPALKV